MSGYGTATDVETLLEAMRDKMTAATTDITYLKNIEVVSAIPRYSPTDATIYLIWTGSPKEKWGEHTTKDLFVATHQVSIFCMLQTTSPDQQAVILGTDKMVGLATFTGDVIDFYSNNMLGLSGLLGNPGPKVMVPAGGVGVEPVDEREEQFVVFARLEYEAMTRPFEFTHTA